jgi:hypothetical protein
MAELAQFVTQLDKVVDLAGVDKGDDRLSLFLCPHWLHAAGEVNNSKTAMSETDMLIDPNAAGVRTAPHHRFCHRCNDILVCPEIVIVTNPSGYPAHRVILSNVHSPPTKLFLRSLDVVSPCRTFIRTSVHSSGATGTMSSIASPLIVSSDWINDSALLVIFGARVPCTVDRDLGSRKSLIVTISAVLGRRQGTSRVREPP